MLPTWHQVVQLAQVVCVAWPSCVSCDFRVAFRFVLVVISCAKLCWTCEWKPRQHVFCESLHRISIHFWEVVCRLFINSSSVLVAKYGVELKSCSIIFFEFLFCVQVRQVGALYLQYVVCVFLYVNVLCYDTTCLFGSPNICCDLETSTAWFLSLSLVPHAQQ